MKPIKTGIASYGLSGQVFHTPFVHANPGFELTAVVERSRDLVRARYPQVRRETSYESLLADPQIELVVVNTPDTTHYEFVKMALAAGKHVIVEKPFVSSLGEAEELVSLAEREGLLLTVYQNRRFDGDFQTVKQIYDSGALGRVVEFDSAYQRFRNVVVAGTWKERADRHVGLTYNLGSHAVDQALVLFGMPDAVFADIDTLRDGSAVDDYFNITLYYPRMRANLKAGYLMREPGPHYRLHGTAGSYVVYGMDPQEEGLKVDVLPGNEAYGVFPESQWGVLHTDAGREKFPTVNGNYMRYYDNIYDVLRRGSRPEVTHVQMLELIRILESCFASRDSGEVIRLK